MTKRRRAEKAIIDKLWKLHKAFQIPVALRVEWDAYHATWCGPRKRRDKKKDSEKRIGELDAELWEVFSEFIRLRDTDINGYGLCRTCGKELYWKGTGDAQAGHFVPKRHKATRFDERNVHLQCSECNGLKKGRMEDMGLYIDRHCGNGVAGMLKQAGRTTGFKLPRTWYYAKIQEYRRRRDELFSEKYFDFEVQNNLKTGV